MAPGRRDEAQDTGGLLNPSDDDFTFRSEHNRERAEEHAVDPLADMTENELHAGVGQTCPRCGRAIKSGQAVRRTVSGAYQHDAC
jgi:hypothetical protein